MTLQSLCLKYKERTYLSENGVVESFPQTYTESKHFPKNRTYLGVDDRKRVNIEFYAFNLLYFGLPEDLNLGERRGEAEEGRL